MGVSSTKLPSSSIVPNTLAVEYAEDRIHSGCFAGATGIIAGAFKDSERARRNADAAKAALDEAERAFENAQARLTVFG
jgi:hypothetical protein